MVIPKLKGQSRDDIVKEMVHFLKKGDKITKEKDLYEMLIKREDLGSTAIGDGVAIPHCKMKGVNNPLLSLAVSKKGVDFNSLDGLPSHIFFLVVSSQENPSLNLQILAAIAHLVRKSEILLDKILNAENAGDMIDVIQEEEEKINE
jgi:mannitol/fructose-specific phosphotransferase system IIA component (Ntr-type)